VCDDVTDLPSGRRTVTGEFVGWTLIKDEMSLIAIK
jgi:hypothetical protein